MNIIIVGCGKVGRALAEQLSKEGHDITVIDTRYDKVQTLCNELDVMGFAGSGSSHSVQEEAGIDNADLLIAVTGSDELNLLCCLIAKKVGNCKTIARVRSPEYYQEARFIKEELGLAMIINPELAVSAEIARLLRFPSAIKLETFAKGRVELLQYRISEGSVLHNMQLSSIKSQLKCDILICAVARGDDVIIPDGNFVLQEHDIIAIVAPPKQSVQFFKHINVHTNAVKNAMIVGGSTTSYYLAKELHATGIDVKIIEKNYERCEHLSDTLPEATMIFGDGTDQNLLTEEGIEHMDSFVALTNLDEENIILSLFVNDLCPKAKIITKINGTGFNRIISKLNLDCTINPKFITAEYIIQYVRAMNNSIGSNVATLYQLMDNRIEALEFTIKENAPVLDTPLLSLKLKKNLLIACIIRNHQIITPGGHDMMKLGDRVIVVTSNTGLDDISDILEQ